MIKTTNYHVNYWKNRNIDWIQSYLSTWNHPHRQKIIDKLRQMKWISLYEIGCGAGENLLRIQTEFPDKDFGGMDINKEAIKTAFDAGIKTYQKLGKKGKHWFLEARDINNGIFLSDNGVDIILTDMMCIYLGPFKIKKVLKEIKRVARFNVVFVEFHSESWWQRLRLWLKTGYFSYDWKKLLEQNGFYNIKLDKLTKEDWGGEPQISYGYIITAKT